MPEPEPIRVRYGNGDDEELELRIKDGLLVIGIEKGKQYLYLTSAPFHELRDALDKLADNVRPG